MKGYRERKNEDGSISEVYDVYENICYDYISVIKLQCETLGETIYNLNQKRTEIHNKLREYLTEHFKGLYQNDKTLQEIVDNIPKFLEITFDKFLTTDVEILAKMFSSKLATLNTWFPHIYE